MNITIGCRANQYQTGQLAAQFPGENVIIVNTCCVTADAERTSRRAIRRAIRENPKARVIASGCLVKLAKDRLTREFPGVEFAESSLQAPISPNKSLLVPPQVRAPLMIQDGCDQFCSYCIVPYARGPVRSKPADQVVREAQELVSSGAKEIVLTGINFGAYQFDLSSLIPRLSSLPGLLRVRLSSIEPMYLTKELIDKLAAFPKVCRHLHLPLQSGDDDILAAMNRRYTTSEYIKLVEYARKRMPDCGITTDIIVGFPGETEQQFKNTVKTVKQVSFSRLHVFPYSKRQGTAAASFPSQVHGKIIKERVSTLRKLSDKLAVKFAKQYLKQEVEVLVENKGIGLTSNYIRCQFPPQPSSIGTLWKIKVSSVTANGEVRTLNVER